MTLSAGFIGIFRGKKKNNTLGNEKKATLDQIQREPNTAVQVDKIMDGATNPAGREGKQHNPLSLDILDLSPLINIYAESEAVEAFDNEMGKERKGAFQKMKGFFARSFQRMGRDAWIDTKKREISNDIRTGLKNGTYTEGFLREHIKSGDEGIVENAYLAHEKESKTDTLPKNMQAIVDRWMSAPPNSADRRQKTEELKSSIEYNYPTITSDFTQIEASLLRLEQAKISSEVDTMEAKFNILDLGRIEHGNGNRKEGWYIKRVDAMSNKINTLKINDGLKQKLLGTVLHPNTAAVLTAIGTRAGVGMIAGSTVAAGFAGGFLLPIVAGSVAGGLFAGVRAHREMRDRTAQIDRRGAMGLQTGNKQVDGLSSDSIRNASQESVSTLYQRVYAAHNSVSSEEDAMIASIQYLVKHKVGRENSINMLQYDADVSISRQHVDMIRLMNEVFPGLVARFNDETLQSPNNKSHEAKIMKGVYNEARTLAMQKLQNRTKEEGKYALKQGLIFGASAAIIGGTIGAAVHAIMSAGSEYTIESITPDESTTHYPDNLTAYKDIQRSFWYDNRTPAPRFDHTELMARTDKNGNWNISKLINKTVTALPNHNHTIRVSDFSSKNIQAVITPMKGGPSFVLPIDAKGNIEIPPSMRSAFDNRTFAWMEVGEVKIGTDGRVDLHPMTTVVGKGNMAFDIITETIAGSKVSTLIQKDIGWWAIPFGVNRYHELGKRNIKDRIRNILNGKSPQIENKVDRGNMESPMIHTSPTIALTGPIAPVLLTNPQSHQADMLQLEGKGAISAMGIGYTQANKQKQVIIEKEELNILWNDIVKIRQMLEETRLMLEERHVRDNEIIKTSTLNMQNMHAKHLEILLEIYHSKRRAWNDQIKNIENISHSDTKPGSVIIPPYVPNIHI